MRDANRIKPFCDEFAELWAQYPDLRFGQIMYCVADWADNRYGKDIFYIEEDELMEIIKEFLGGKDERTT